MYKLLGKGAWRTTFCLLTFVHGYNAWDEKQRKSKPLENQASFKKRESQGSLSAC